MSKFMTLEESRASGWKFYQRAMKGQDYPIHPHYVPIGFFRVENRSGKSWPLAIWEADGKKLARVGEAETVDLSEPKAEEDFAYNTFQYCCRRPIDFKAYEHWMAHRTWPASVGPQAVIEASLAVRAVEPGVGDNSGRSEEIDHEAFVDQVRAALAGVLDLKTVTNAEQVAAANSLRNRLTELAGQGAKKHEVEKKPHLDAGRAVDGRWNPIIAEAKAGAATLKRAIDDLKTAELRAKREREAAQAAASNPVTEAAPVERIESTYGKRSSVKTVLIAKVIDYGAVYRQLHSNPEIIQLLDKLAQKVITAGGRLEGVETEERASVR